MRETAGLNPWFRWVAAQTGDLELSENERPCLGARFSRFAVIIHAEVFSVLLTGMERLLKLAHCRGC